jgi:predicted nuclease of restriction endonuclease-like (RecB) superfamily
MNETNSQKSRVKSLKKSPIESQFSEIAEMAKQGRSKAAFSVNAIMLQTYWLIGQFISTQMKKARWTEKNIRQQSDFLQKAGMSQLVYSAQNLEMMRQFYENYRDYKKVSAVLALLSWSSHLQILSKLKSKKDRDNYLNLAIQDGLDASALGQAIDSDLLSKKSKNK